MKVSIHEDKWGCQITVDERSFDLSKDEVRELHFAIIKFLGILTIQDMIDIQNKSPNINYKRNK